MDTVKSGRLLQQAQAGDQEAFAQIFEDLRPAVDAVACRLVGPDDADDVVMETYLKAWRALKRFRGGSQLKTWLYRITHNCATDFLRRRKRRVERVLPEDEQDGRTISELEDTDAPSAPQQLAAVENRELLRQALGELDDPHRVVLLLRYQDNLSYQEIAAACGIHLGTVMSRLFNAKRKLKQIFDRLERGHEEMV